MTETIKNATKTTEKKAVATAPKKAVEKKEPKPKTDFKAIAEGIESAFKADKTVDVKADTSLNDPRALSESDYRYIHFYNPGTEKHMFGCYLIGKGRVRFALSLKVEEFLSKDLTITPVLKAKKKGEEKRKVAIDVICDVADAADVAKKIISAYQQIPAKVKAEKPAKAEKKTTEKKPAEKKAEPKKVTAKKAEPKKVANK